MEMQMKKVSVMLITVLTSMLLIYLWFLIVNELYPMVYTTLFNHINIGSDPINALIAVTITLFIFVMALNLLLFYLLILIKRLFKVKSIFSLSNKEI